MIAVLLFWWWQSRKCKSWICLVSPVPTSRQKGLRISSSNPGFYRALRLWAPTQGIGRILAEKNSSANCMMCASPGNWQWFFWWYYIWGNYHSRPGTCWNQTYGLGIPCVKELYTNIFWYWPNSQCHLRLAQGVGTGGSSVVHACRIGEIFGSDVFQRCWGLNSLIIFPRHVCGIKYVAMEALTKDIKKCALPAGLVRQNVGSTKLLQNIIWTLMLRSPTSKSRSALTKVQVKWSLFHGHFFYQVIWHLYWNMGFTRFSF